MSTMRWTSYVAVGALTAALLSVVGIYSTQKDESSSQSSSFGLFYNQEYGASNITVDELSPYRFLSTDDASPNGNAGMHGPTGAGKEELIPHSYWWIVFFVLSFCYSFNQKAFNVYCRLRRRNTHRWRLVVRRATCISGLLYLIFGVFGFLAYLKQDDGEASADVLKKVNFFSENNYTNKLIFDIAR